MISDEAICKIVGSVLPATATRGGVTPDMDLRADLGLDSVGLMSIVFLLDEEVDFDVFGHVQQFIEARTVSDLIEVVRR